jgi:hypothetical protein
MKKYLIAILSITVISISTYTVAIGGWQQPTKITQFIIEGSPAGERIYVQFENDFNPDSCTGKDTRWKRIYGDTEKGKYLLSTVMSAKATGQTVTPLLYGCDDWGRPALSGIWVQ